MSLARHVGLGLCASLLLLVPRLAATGQGQPRGAPRVSSDGLLQIDPVYIDIVARTGGEIYANGPGETRNDYARAMRGAVWNPIALRHGELPTEGDVGVTAEVGPRVSRLRFYVFAQKKVSVDIRRPDGRVVTSSDPGVEWIEPRFMLFTTVSDPEPGVWTLAFAGQGRYLASLRTGTEPVVVSDFEFQFVHVAGRPGHQGLFTLEEPPAAGSEAICKVVLFHDVDSPTFAFESADGSGNETLDLTRNPPREFMGKSEPSNEFLGECRVPREPFRFVVRGVHRNGPYRHATDLLLPGTAPRSKAGVR